MLTAKYKLLPCPFCKMQSETGEGWEDTMYPTGFGWREDIGIIDDTTPFRHYLGRSEYDRWQGECWEINCATNYGGCGAHISGDSELEVVEKWNRRN